MTIEQTTLVAQIVGVIAVAATLIYLDLQVQQGAAKQTYTTSRPFLW